MSAGFVKVEWVECDKCEGSGRIPHMISLSVDGAQDWEWLDCPDCGGDGIVQKAPEDPDQEGEE